MAFGPGSDAVVQVDDDGGSLTDISPYLSGGDFETARDTKRLTVLGGNAQSVIVQSPATSGTLEGYYDGAAIDVFQTFMEDPAPATRTMQIDPQGSGSGLDRFTGEALFSNFKVEFPGDDVATFSVDWDINGSWTRSTI